MCHLLQSLNVFFWSCTSLMHSMFFLQSCPPLYRWTATWRNRSTCGRTTHPTSWQRRPSMLQWQHSNHTVLSVHSSVPTQRYSHTLQQKHICVSEVVMVVIAVSVQKVSGNISDAGRSVVKVLTIRTSNDNYCVMVLNFPFIPTVGKAGQ